MKSLTGKRVLVTGVGIKALQCTFNDITSKEPTHTAIISEGKEYKANIGAATALECARAGAIVHLVARTESKLQVVKSWIESTVPDAVVEYSAIDLSNSAQLRQLVDTLPTAEPLYWVQSVGIGAGTVQLNDDNPYLVIENISQELVEAELSVLTSTIELLKLLLPRFRSQTETRVCIVSSMSAVRSVTSGSMHMAAKGAISRFTNAAMIELNPENIFITDIRPGAVDTGMYDSKEVQNTVAKIATTYNYDWTEKAGGLRLAPPSAVARAIVTALTSEAHLTSVNMVARGQWPHEGS